MMCFIYYSFLLILSVPVEVLLLLVVAVETLFYSPKYTIFIKRRLISKLSIFSCQYR